MANKEDNIEPSQNDTKGFQNKHSAKSMNNIIVLGGEILIIVGVAITFFYFCYLIREVINPIVLFIILIASLVPFWRFMWAKAVLFVILFLFSLWVIYKSGYLVAPFIWGFFIAYLFDPIITKMEKRIPRLAGVILIFIPLVILTFIFAFFILPRFLLEIKKIFQYLPSHTANIANSISNFSIYITDWLNNNLAGSRKFNFIIDNNMISEFLFGAEGVISGIYKYITNIFSIKNINNLTKMVSIIFSYFVILPFVSFYLMLDFQNIKRRIIKLIPVRWQESIEDILSKSNYIINGYIRGMTILAVTFFILTYILLMLTSTKYTLVLAIFRGLFNYIPFIGPFVAFLSALFIGIVTEEIWWYGIIKMCVIYGIIQIIDSGLLAPKVLGKSVKIHPIAVMFTTIMGGVLFGFIGVLFAVPMSAVMLLVFKKFFIKYYNSKFYSAKRKHI